MPRPIRCESRYDVPAETLYTTLVNRDYLRKRLAEIGGRNANLVELTADAESAEYVLLQGVGREQLPGLIQGLFSGDLMIERTESWQRVAPGEYRGTVRAEVRDTPGRISGELRLADASGGSAYELTGTARVSVPLIGGKIESLIVDQITKLVESESRFTRDWLDR